LVDTRGVGSSTPRLGCPELDRAAIRDFHARPYVGSHGTPIFSQALRDCRRRLTSYGIDVADYTVQESVADLETLRRALGVSQWNLMAVSADGILGMSYLREHPENMRSVIVDSAMAPQMVAGIDYDRGLHLQLEKIFAGCAANRACRQAYPHVRRSFMRAVRRLNNHPQMVRIPAFQPHPIRLRIDGIWVYFDASHNIFPGNAFAPEEIHGSLDIMWRIGHGQVAEVYRELFGSGPAEFFPENRYLASGRTMSLECHDVVAFLTRGQLRRAIRDFPWYAARYRDRSYDLAHTLINPRSPAGCRIWDVGKAAPRQHQPVVSDVPTLALAGEYDGGVTPYTVRKNVAGLSNATYVEFPGGHHQQLAFFSSAHKCARPMAAAFLADPHATVDTTCADEMPAFDFTPPVGEAEERARLPRAPGPQSWRSWLTYWPV
jgi:pimeloyl-ACP methyl ester carboxylesterase